MKYYDGKLALAAFRGGWTYEGGNWEVIRVLTPRNWVIKYRGIIVADSEGIYYSGPITMPHRSGARPTIRVINQARAILGGSLPSVVL